MSCILATPDSPFSWRSGACRLGQAPQPQGASRQHQTAGWLAASGLVSTAERYSCRARRLTFERVPDPWANAVAKVPRGVVANIADIASWGEVTQLRSPPPYHVPLGQVELPRRLQASLKSFRSSVGRADLTSAALLQTMGAASAEPDLTLARMAGRPSLRS